MKYNELNINSKPARKRVGRGISSGYGKTAGRGTKGQGARTGKNKAPQINRGETGSIRQLPKNRGFKSKRVPAQVVYSDMLDAISEKTIDNFTLYNAGLIASPYTAVKVILREPTKSKATVQVAGMSKSVQAHLTKNGGKFEKTAVPFPTASAESDKA